MTKLTKKDVVRGCHIPNLINGGYANHDEYIFVSRLLEARKALKIEARKRAEEYIKISKLGSLEAIRYRMGVDSALNDADDFLLGDQK